MKTMNTDSIVRASLLGCMLGLAACSGAPETSEREAATVTAALGVGLDGTWDFAVEASDVRADLKAQCQREGERADDPSRGAACWQDVLAESRNEKIRFTHDVSGRLVWTSFAVQGGNEEVFVELPISLTASAQGRITARAAGWPKGTFVGRLKNLNAELEIERPADGSVVIVDPKKGRLVYRRAG
jgi:hypothetical protein